jgi:predicted MFS family arabinose efflux permease
MDRAPNGTQHRPLLAILREAPRPVWVLVGGVFVNRAGSFFATFATLFLRSRHFSLASLPALLIAIAATGMLGSLAGGRLADAVSRRAALVTSAWCSAASLAFVAVAPDQATLVVAVCLAGFCTQSYVPAASALLVDFSKPEERVPLFALLRLALNVGAACGALIAGFLASHSFGLLFTLDAATSAAFACLLLVGLPRDATRRADDVALPEPIVSPPDRRAGLTPGLAITLLAFFGVASVYAQQNSTVPLHLAAQGHSPRLFGALLALNAAIVIAAELPLSSFTRQLPSAIPLAWGAGLIAAGISVCEISRTAIAAAACVVVWTVGEMLLSPVASTAMAAIAPADRVARYQSYLTTAQMLGFSLGPAGGALVFASSSDLLAVICAAIGGVCACVFITTGRMLAGHIPEKGPAAGVSTS